MTTCGSAQKMKETHCRNIINSKWGSKNNIGIDDKKIERLGVFSIDRIGVFNNNMNVIWCVNNWKLQIECKLNMLKLYV